MNVRRLLAAVGFTSVLLLGTTACTEQPTSVQNDQSNTDKQLQIYQANQPIPLFQWSQYRQTAIDVEYAQVHGLATTTFFFNQGVQQPIKSCPSIGYAIPTTGQLTNPSQVVWGSGSASGVVSQQEPNGLYTGDSSGTYVICVAPNGTKYPSYWEGNVQTEGGPAHWDKTQNLIVMDGAPTVEAGNFCKLYATIANPSADVTALFNKECKK